MLLKTALNQFLGCIRLDIKKALVVSVKCRYLAKIKLHKDPQIIKQANAAHKEVVKGICSKIIRRFPVGLFLTSTPVTRQFFEQRQAA